MVLAANQLLEVALRVLNAYTIGRRPASGDVRLLRDSTGLIGDADLLARRVIESELARRRAERRHPTQ